VTKPWPVYYHNDTGSAMLTYYIGQYLIPAAVGKVVGSFRVGEIAVLFWNAAGVFLALLLLFRITKADTARKWLLTAVVFFPFGFTLFLGRGLYAATPFGSVDAPEDNYWISKSIRVYFRSMVNVLRWIPTNAITPWIATALFADQYSNNFGERNYVLLAAPLILYATFPFLGLALLMMGVFFIKLVRPSTTRVERLNALKNCMSASNLCALVSSAVMLAYIFGNVTGEKPEEIGFSIIDYGSNSILYLCVCLTFLCYSVVIFKIHKESPLFYVVNAALLLFPFFRMGRWNDLCMNASVPEVFLLMVFIIQALFKYIEQKNSASRRAAILILLLFIGAIYPARELIDVSKTGPVWDGSGRYGEIQSMNEYARTDGTVMVDYAYNYYTYDYENSMFCKYLAKD